jgi:hypothetical protein
MDNLDPTLAPTDAPISPAPTAPQPFDYVVVDPNTGALLESCYQVPPPAHADAVKILVTAHVRENWLQYRANAARDGVELIPPTPAPTQSPTQIISGYMASVQRHLDSEAVRFGYDDIVSVVSYAEEPSVPRYQTEGQAFRAWRSLVWAKCEKVLADVQGGNRTAPTTEDLITELPELGIDPSSAVASST